MPKENMHYTWIACITVDSVMRIDKKNHPQFYLEEFKYRIKNTQMSRFIKTKLKSDWDSELEFRFRFRIKIWCGINGKIRIWSWFWIRHFTFNNFYSYVFVEFERVILLLMAGHIKPFLIMPIFLREQFFSQVLFQTYFLLGLKTHKHFNKFN